MKLLLDTHAFIWLNDYTERLSEAVKGLCTSGEHEFYLSMASSWEIQIKSQLGKLSLAVPIEEMVNKNQQKNNINLLPINLSHIIYLERLPPHHKDPFDRIIIAQAVIEGIAIVTVDNAFADYPVQLMW